MDWARQKYDNVLSSGIVSYHSGVRDLYISTCNLITITYAINTVLHNASHEQARLLDASTPEYGMNGAFRSRLSWGYTELLCYRLSCTAARLGLATGGISRNWTSSTCAAFAKFSVSAGRTMSQTRRSFAGLSSLALKPCWTWHSFAGQDMSLAWTTADSQNNCSMQSSQLENGTKAGRGSGTKMYWNWPSRPTTFQLTSGKPWPKTGRPGGQLYARAQSTLRKADYRAWMIRDRQGRTECQTLALLYLVSSAARSALPLSGSKLICANTSTDASSLNRRTTTTTQHKQETPLVV